MTWNVYVDKGVLKRLSSLNKRDRTRIISATDELSINPYTGDIRKMEDENNVWRRRVGFYRIFYEVYPKQKIVYVYDVKRRTSTTY